MIGAAIGSRLFLLEYRSRAGELDVRVLHERLLGKALGIGEEAVRDEKHLRYIRGVERGRGGSAPGRGADRISAEADCRSSRSPTPLSRGGVMPQKSTDFYPKLLSGLTIYKLD